ncbi:hypothetical protein Ancab_031877, partial [Ancistrocladus abbreviatus]
QEECGGVRNGTVQTSPNVEAIAREREENLQQIEGRENDGGLVMLGTHTRALMEMEQDFGVDGGQLDCRGLVDDGEAVTLLASGPLNTTHTKLGHSSVCWSADRAHCPVKTGAAKLISPAQKGPSRRCEKEPSMLDGEAVTKGHVYSRKKGKYSSDRPAELPQAHSGVQS